MTVTHRAHRTWSWARIGALALAMAVVTLGTTPGQAQTSEDEKIFEVGLDLAFEHDDNVNLGSGLGPGEAERSDYVWHAKPQLKLGLDRPHQKLGLNLQGDYRRGTDTELDEQNLIASGDVDLEFEGGWGVRVFDRYVKTEFDQAVFFSPDDPGIAEPGISASRANTYGAEVRLAPKRLFRLFLGYDATDETVDFDSDADSTSDQRDVTNISIKLSVPMGRSWALFAYAKEEEQEASVRLSRSFDDVRVAGGVTWRSQRGNRVSVEAGREKVDFYDAPGVEYEQTVALASYEHELSKHSLVKASAGVDAFGEFIYDGLFERIVEGTQSTRVRVRRFTQKSFSASTRSPILDAFLASLLWDRRFKQSWRVSFDANYLILQSPDGVTQDDTTSNATLRLFYDLTRPIQIGAYYRWAKRDSNRPANEFVDNRVGVMVRLHN